MGFVIAVSIAAGVFITGMAGAYIKTGKMILPNRISTVLSPFYRMAMIWYGIKSKRDGSRIDRAVRQKEQVLIRQFAVLEPSVPARQQLAEFQTERMAKCLLCIFLGMVLSLSVAAAGLYSGVIQSDGSIQRNDYGQGEVQVDLLVSSGEQQEKVAFVVEERVYTKEETAELFRQVEKQVEAAMLGANQSLAHVTGSLILPRNIEGFPFDIAWESSAYDLVDADGTVHNKELTDPVPVTLTATFKYRDYRFYTTQNVILYPPVYSDEELFSQAVSKALKQENELSAEQDRFKLPQRLADGMKLYWEEAESRDGFLILFIAMLAAVVVFIAHEREVESRIKEREKELVMDYSELIGKLTLYMGAGMTIRNVFMRLGEEYGRKKTSKKQYLYEEITLTCHELQMGISETEAYEHFGRRCKLRQYVRLTALLTQNLKKGSSNLAQMLHQESRDAFESRKNMARKLGEEAGTKLLGPMIMMLCVVMVMIMVPAYLSFGM